MCNLIHGLQCEPFELRKAYLILIQQSHETNYSSQCGWNCISKSLSYITVFGGFLLSDEFLFPLWILCGGNSLSLFNTLKHLTLPSWYLSQGKSISLQKQTNVQRQIPYYWSDSWIWQGVAIVLMLLFDLKLNVDPTICNVFCA